MNNLPNKSGAPDTLDTSGTNAACNQGGVASRGAVWLSELTRHAPLNAGYPLSVQVADASLNNGPARFIAVVPDPGNRFPRARHGEVGLIEGWEVARAVQDVIAADCTSQHKRPIVAVIDVVSQAYGRREEAYGIHLALAAATNAYVSARLAGHPVLGLIVGKAMSGAFLAHGYQANRLIALNDPQVMVHAMGKASAARVTMRTVAEMEALAASIAPMAYDIASVESLGLLWRSLVVDNANNPTAEDIRLIEKTLHDALAEIDTDQRRDLSGRLGAANRAASTQVRALLRAQWSEGTP